MSTTERPQDSKITLIIVTLDYHMKRAKRHSKYRCHYDSRTQMIDIKQRMFERISTDQNLKGCTLADIFVTVALTESSNDGQEPTAIGNKEKVSMLFLDDFSPLAVCLNGKKVDKKKTYIRMVVRESHASK